MREIGLLRATWRALETESRNLLNGHEGGNAGYGQGSSYGFYAPALDPTRNRCAAFLLVFFVKHPLPPTIEQAFACPSR